MAETEIIQQSIYKSLDNYYCHHKDNYNQLHHQDYHHRIYLSNITYFYDSTYYIFRNIVPFHLLEI